MRHNGVRVQDHVSVRAGAASFESDAGRHIINYLSCIKSRQRPVCDIEIGAFSTIPTLMAAFPFSEVACRKTVASRSGNGAAMGLMFRLRHTRRLVLSERFSSWSPDAPGGGATFR